MKMIKRFVLGNLLTNCYLINQKDKTILIDAGVDANKVVDYLIENKMKLDYIFITHCHYDHIGGLEYLVDNFPNVEVVVGKKEQKYLLNPDYNLSTMDDLYYTYTGKYTTFEDFDYSSLDMEIRHISGHSLDGLCFYFPNDKEIFVGDTLFRNTIGRSDLVDGNEYLLKQGIKEQLFSLEDDIKVHPGHGFGTTIGKEKENNPEFK